MTCVGCGRQPGEPYCLACDPEGWDMDWTTELVKQAGGDPARPLHRQEGAVLGAMRRMATELLLSINECISEGVG